MNIKYATSEMLIEGVFPSNYEHMRVLETQLRFLDATHVPTHKLLTEGKKYEGDLLFNMGKGGFEKPYIKALYGVGNVVEKLKECFDNVYIYQDGELGWWNQVDVKLQVWWYNNISTADGILVPNSSDTSYYDGILPSSTKVSVIRSVMTDVGLDPSKFKPKEDRVILNGPFTPDYNALPQVLLAHQTNLPIDIPEMGRSRMQEDSWQMAESLGVNYLPYMSWIEWMYNLNRYKIGYMLTPSIASGSFALNCAYLGIPCIGYAKADTQRLLFPDLAIDVFDNQKAAELTKRLMTDEVFYSEVATKARWIYSKEFTKDKMLNILEQ
jgi:hypothetical protein